MNAGRLARAGWVPFLLAALGGCGAPAGSVYSDSPPGSPTTRRLVFVGFDSSQPLVNALMQGKLQGLVVQDPFKMGEVGVGTLVDSLEKREVPVKVSTGET